MGTQNESNSFSWFNLGLVFGIAITLVYQYKNNPTPIILDQDTIEVYFTYPKTFRPLGFITCESILISLINNAKKNIRVLAYNWTSINIANAIASAHQRGVEIRIILDKENQSRENKAVAMINENSKELNIRSISGISHNKVIIIDDYIVCTGSYNFSRAANEKNDENMLVIRSSEVAKKYTQAWHKIREYVHGINEEKPQLKKWNELSTKNLNYGNRSKYKSQEKTMFL
jgi:phosphatidylserine/phosphatidylglycerophosphate/cardiolipin synthase-like enzyme